MAAAAALGTAGELARRSAVRLSVGMTCVACLVASLAAGPSVASATSREHHGPTSTSTSSASHRQAQSLGDQRSQGFVDVQPTAAAVHPPALGSPDAPARMILSTNYDATDPSVLHVGGDYLLYTTGGGFANSPHVVVHVGSSIGKWTSSHEALPRLPAWTRDNVWAPAVQQVQGGWALYFTGTVTGSDPSIQCIGAAFAAKPVGPFVSEGDPIVCQVDHRGSIDPRTYVDPQGSLWLDWKSDDNADPNTPGPDQGGLTGIYAQRLSANGRQLLGQPSEIFQPDQPWEGTIVESPQMIDIAGSYYLFFSANWFNQPYYGIGVASCASVTGPCHSLGSAPFLGSNNQGSGPGEPSVYVSPGGVYLLYTPVHAAAPDITPPRPVAMARVGFSSNGPYLAAFS
jgi:Glycosyl hydrolases family 43